MKFEVVQLEERVVMGYTIRTNNQNPQVGALIGGTWQKLFHNLGSVCNRKNGRTLGIYSAYESDEKGDYDFTAGCEVEREAEGCEGQTRLVLPAGKYAKFIVEGPMAEASARFWGKLWSMKLERAFTYDLEEYITGNPEHVIIHIYIAVK